MDNNVVNNNIRNGDNSEDDGQHLMNLKPVKLERVLGFTLSSNASLDCDPNTGAIVYPAGCVIVVYNPRKNKQSNIVNASKKTITSLAVSGDGKYVVTGECGHLPSVRVWDIQERLQVAEFSGHKFGINCVAFSPNLKYVVSVGSQHDMIVSVWDWRNNIKVASNKVSSKVKAVAFSQGGNYFVTVGNRHVKFWYLEYASRSSKYKEPVPLMGRSAILGEQRNNNFCDVACGLGEMSASTFAITKSGLLCEFNSRRLLDKWVELRTPSANCLAVGNDFIFIGCAEGIIRCFTPYSLQFVTTLPRTHHLGVDVTQGTSIAHMGSHPQSAKYPDSIAITYDATGRKVTSIYNDHSLYVWDVKDIKKVGKSHSFLYHSACIWGIEMYPTVPSNCQVALPSGSFVTCSSDDTIRIWNLDANMSPTVSYKRNIYSNELLKVMYVDEDLAFLCDTDRNIGNGTDKMDTTYDSKNGVRCIRISPDGQHLASGDRSGNIRIHELVYLDEVCKIEAHDAEVLNLEYSRPDTGRRLLASASRDRLIHVFDLDQDYAFQQTLDDHSSSITAVRFVNVNQQLQMISCGADKSVIFRTAQYTPNPQFARDHHVVGKTTLYDMEIDAGQKHILTACQDRNIRVYNVVSGKQTKTFKGSLGEDGSLIKLALDASGHFLATSCTDKSLCIYDYLSGDCVATMYGHSELVTGLRFTHDCKHLISVSGDGCIFIWKLPMEISHPMQVRLAQSEIKTRQTVKNPMINNNTTRVSKEPDSPPSVPSPVPPITTRLEHAVPKGFVAARAEMFNPNGEVDATSPDYRFSVGPLPLWAKKQIAEEPTNSGTSSKTSSTAANIAQPKGRWAQRVDGQGVAVRSFYSSDQIIPYPNQAARPASPNLGKSPDLRKETIVITKEDIPDNGRFSPCPESLRQIKAGPLGEDVTKQLGEPLDEVLKQKRAQKALFWEMSIGGVTTKRVDSLPPRPRRFTDTSSVSSLQVEGLEEDEGDAEDEGSETDNSTEIAEIIYYPPSEGTGDTDNEFKVCATNPEDMRESHRRTRRGRQDRPTDLPIVSVQQHDSEDDEPTTPQPTDRNPMSAFSISMESLDRVGHRERFLKSNFDSLDKTGNGELGLDGVRGAADGFSAHDDDDETIDKRSSLSARYHGSTPRDSTSRAKLLPEGTSPRKLEIMRQMEKSRKKLDTIGWKATMNSSKSIGDLTDLPEKDTSGRYLSAKDGMNQVNVRRAASMTDLSYKSPARILPNPVQNNVASNRRHVPSSREPPGTQLYRSNSAALLNQSDSETDNSSDHQLGKKNGVSAAMRPTISSLNKAVQGTTGNVRQRLADRRNRASHRADEENGAARTMTLPRNPRSTLGSSFSKSERDISRIGEPHMDGRLRSNNAHSSVMDLNSKRDNASRTRVTGNHLEKSPHELPVKDDRSEVISVVEADLTEDLCASASNNLRLAADNVLQLYKRVTLDSDLAEEEKASCLSALVESAAQAQQTLKPIPPLGHVPLLSLDTSVNVANLGNVGGANNPEMMMFLQQYSDKLLSVFQQRITSQNT